jgi:hypothetical protein
MPGSEVEVLMEVYNSLFRMLETEFIHLRLLENPCGVFATYYIL